MLLTQFSGPDFPGFVTCHFVKIKVNFSLKGDYPVLPGFVIRTSFLYLLTQDINEFAVSV
jgi:hypothetical protein